MSYTISEVVSNVLQKRGTCIRCPTQFQRSYQMSYKKVEPVCSDMSVFSYCRTTDIPRNKL